MKKLKIFLLLLFPLALFSQTGIPPRPDPPVLYNNLSKLNPDFISPADASALENKLEQFADTTSNQIVVVITDNIGDNDINEYATGIGNTWGVGQSKLDNGVIIVINLGGGVGNRDAYIAVGQGLEGIIPDATAYHISEDYIIPQFKAGNYAQGINDAVDEIMALAKGEINSKDYESSRSDGKHPPIEVIIFIVIAIIFIFIRFRFRSGVGGFFIGGGGWGSGGRGGFGGGGGGFGGFGGGSFGGGGGGGKW
ncbi:MAG TPA: TPM domain-containing protein [Bacteroidia bacterium]|jgi:uncharacterized protein|nr:TPM domain-containing protein [Bacteroidia bacterium]